MIGPLSSKHLPSQPTSPVPHLDTSTSQIPVRNTLAREQKLHRATQEFEAMLIANFWKSMTESFSNSDEDSLDPGHSTWQDMGVQAMSEALSKAGGFGLGKMILKHLEPLVQDAGPRTPATKS